MMSGGSSVKQNELGPNYLGYYKHLFFELFPQTGDSTTPLGSDLEPLLGYPRGEVEGTINPNNAGKGKSRHHSVSFFTRVIGEELSEYKKERLKAVLHQTAVCLNQEADEIFGRILATLQIESDLREKEQVPCHPSVSDDELCEPLYGKKQKSSSSPDNFGCSNTLNVNAQFGTKVYNDIQAVQGDGAICLKAVEMYSHKINEKLSEMKENVEEYVDMVVSKCRPMTGGEKHQLGRKIQKLPRKALDGIVEIFHRRTSLARDLSDDIFVNLEELDNVTLWRLYYYVQAVGEAKEL